MSPRYAKALAAAKRIVFSYIGAFIFIFSRDAHLHRRTHLLLNVGALSSPFL